MVRIATPPEEVSKQGDEKVCGWWHTAGDRVICDLCPRHCALKAGARGFCFVRQNVGGQLVLTTYGRSTGFCIDPVEKKPLNHFYPGSSVLSFGTAGCNLGCKFCQAWEITKSRHVLNRLSQQATPETIAEVAQRLHCRSVAFTYNDPVVWAEYTMDCARACHLRGLKTIAVTAGYMEPAARPAFFGLMDAANVDLKGFSEDFYRHLTLSHLEPVLDTLKWIRRATNVWLEITNLVIPGHNEDPRQIEAMCRWIVSELGEDTPVHFTAFHPDYRMLNVPPTPAETVMMARRLALGAGLRYVYTGNVFDPAGQATYCPDCGRRLIARHTYDISDYQLQGNRCAPCGATIAGHFDERPGHWGTRRVSVDPSELLRQLRRNQVPR